MQRTIFPTTGKRDINVRHFICGEINAGCRYEWAIGRSARHATEHMRISDNFDANIYLLKLIINHLNLLISLMFRNSNMIKIENYEIKL